MEPSTFQHYLIGLLPIGNNVSAIGAFLAQTHGLPRAKIKRIRKIICTSCFDTSITNIKITYIIKARPVINAVRSINAQSPINNASTIMCSSKNAIFCD